VTLAKKIGILYQPKTPVAGDLAQQLGKTLGEGEHAVWICSSWDESRACELADETDFVISLGGDGTILRAARVASPRSIPILAVNLGRVGFMTEVPADEALERVPGFVDGQEGWIEERHMLQAELVTRETGEQYQALNDVVVARGERCRLIRVKVTIDGEPVSTYKCDGVILATPTGSTGYAMAAGGPVLHPLASEIVLQPVAAHLSPGTTLVLPSESVVDLEVSTYHQATLSIDGQIEVPLSDGDVVRVKPSPQVTRLLKSQSSKSFYSVLMQKLPFGE
jgi:NAD+ kinase